MKLFRRPDPATNEERCAGCGTLIADETEARRLLTMHVVTAAFSFIAWREIVARRRYVEQLAAATDPGPPVVVDEDGQVIAGPLGLVHDAAAADEPDAAEASGA